jgi:hypothetical protein
MQRLERLAPEMDAEEVVATLKDIEAARDERDPERREQLLNNVDVLLHVWEYGGKLGDRS